MTQFYFDPRREPDPYTLPDAEVFHLDAETIARENITNENGETLDAGWYYWACFPGCLPDSDPMGPFDTEEDALLDAREGYDDETEYGED